MDDNDQDLDEDFEPQEKEGSKSTKSIRQEFSKLVFELTDEDLSSKGVQKLLLAEISRLEKSESKTEIYRDRFHSKDKEAGILKEGRKTHLYSEILYSVALTVGAILIGLSPSINKSDASPWMVGGIGCVLIIVAVIAKVIKK